MVNIHKYCLLTKRGTVFSKVLDLQPNSSNPLDSTVCRRYRTGEHECFNTPRRVLSPRPMSVVQFGPSLYFPYNIPSFFFSSLPSSPFLLFFSHLLFHLLFPCIFLFSFMISPPSFQTRKWSLLHSTPDFKAKKECWLSYRTLPSPETVIFQGYNRWYIQS